MPRSVEQPDGVLIPDGMGEMRDDLEEPLAAGTRVKGEYRCSTCAYGVTVYRELPVCPMCGSESWEQVAWSPFSRAAARVGSGRAS